MEFRKLYYIYWWRIKTYLLTYLLIKREICFLLCTPHWCDQVRHSSIYLFSQTHSQTIVDDENKLVALLHDETGQLSTVIFLEYLLPGQLTLLFQWFDKTLTCGIVCQVEHQSNIVVQTYLILTTSFWHWFTFKHCGSDISYLNNFLLTLIYF